MVLLTDIRKQCEICCVEITFLSEKIFQHCDSLYPGNNVTVVSEREVYIGNTLFILCYYFSSEGLVIEVQMIYKYHSSIGGIKVCRLKE
jgi:hypothetical protein